jgi:hypothetical protein
LSRAEPQSQSLPIVSVTSNFKLKVKGQSISDPHQRFLIVFLKLRASTPTE